MTSLPLSEFSYNGVSEPFDEPYPYLEQAHGVLHCIEEAMLGDENRGPINPKLLLAAVRAAGTLVHLSAFSLDVMDRNKAAWHAERSHD